MEKNMLNKISTAGVVLSIAALVSLSGVFGANSATAANGYGYGYNNASSPDFLLPDEDGNVSVNGKTDTKTGNDDNTSEKGKTEETTTEETTTEETTTEETTTEETTDRIVKVDGEKVYTLNNKKCPVYANIVNPEYNASQEITFTDIASSKYKSDIARLARTDIVRGTSDTTFEPSRGITRAEFLAIVLQSHCIDIKKNVTSTPFTDLEIGDWKTNVVATALDAGVIYGDTKDGKRVFRANDTISKIEAMAILTSMRDIQIDSEYTHGYTDVAADWQNRVLNIVDYLGLEEKGSTFNPNSTIARDVMTHYIVNTVKLY